MARTGLLKTAFACFAALAALLGGAAAGEGSGSAWLVDWDREDGMGEAAYLAEALESLQLFAAVFDQEDRPQLGGDFDGLPPGRRLFLSVVNDGRAADGKSVLKDPDLVSRLLATEESRAAHRGALLHLLETGGFSGLELDYERVTETDWPRYLDFCRELSEELAAGDRRLRVVLEPKRMYYTQPLPPGPEYSIMAYNLHGPHSGPGPKATPAFIAGLAARCLPATGPARVAISTGGFLWRGEERAAGITEKRAVELARLHKAETVRDPDSRYLHFSFMEDGVRGEVWYADALTLDALFRAARDHGFAGIDIWRLGGNSKSALETIRNAILPEHTGRTLRVGGDGHPSIAQALREARPGDSIVIEPGEYRESFSVDTGGLRVTCPAGLETAMPVTVTGTIRISSDSEWRGIRFTQEDPDSPLVELDGFTGGFDHCAFVAETLSPGTKAILVYGGSPTFNACVFEGGGTGTALSLFAISPPSGPPRSFIDFRFCLFRNFGDNVAELNEDVDLRFANCLFTRNGRILRRLARHTGQVEFVNSVFFFNRGQYLSNHSEKLRPIRVVNCLTTPHITQRYGAGFRSLAEQPGVEAENCLSGSPRFRGIGRRLALNLGVDEVANLDGFAVAAEVAERLRQRITLAVGPFGVSEEAWRRIGEFSRKGHEIASLTADRVSTRMEPPLSLGYPLPHSESATLSIVPGREMRIEIDGKVLGTIALDDDGLSLAALVRRLSRLGLATRLSPHYAGAPAALLAGVERLDIAFPRPATPLYLRREDYLQRQIPGSHDALRGRLPEAGTAFVNPHGEAAPAIRQAAAAAGYAAVRSAPGSDPGERSGEAARPAIDPYAIPAVSLAVVRSLLPDTDLAECVRLATEYARYGSSSGGALALYSRSPDSPGQDEWRRILDYVDGDPEILLMSLTEIAAEARTDDWVMREAAAPGSEAADFRPASGSPLLNAGKRLGLTRDFAGNPLDPQKRPTIGLFQEE